MKHENEIREMIANHINDNETIRDIDIDAELLDAGMDSLAFIRLIVAIEDKYDFEFSDENLALCRSGTIRKLCEIILQGGTQI